jgi:hypothetical protein
MAEELDMDKDAFLRVFTSEQGTPQQLLKMEGSELQKFIESCVGIEQLDKTLKRCNQETNNNNAAAKAISDLILSDDDVSAKEDNAAKMEETLFNLETSLTQLANETIEALADREALVKRLQLAEASNNVYNIYGTKKSQMIGMVEQPLIDFSDDEAILKTVNAQLSDQDNIATLDRRLANINRQIDSIVYVEVLDKIPRDKAKDVHDKAMSTCADLNAKVKSLKLLLEDTSCPTCKRPYELDTECLQRMELELVEATEAFQEASKVLGQSAKHLEEVDSHNRRAERITLENQSLGNNKNRLLTERSGIESDLHMYVRADIPTLTIQKAALQASITKDTRTNADAEANNRLLNRLKDELSKLTVPTEDPIDTGPLKHKLDVLNDNLEYMRNKKSTLEQLKLSTSHGLDSVKKELEWHATHKIAFDKHTSRSKLCKVVSDVLSGSRVKIINEALSVIFAVASEFASACTDGDMQEVLVHEGSISYREGGVIYNKFNASGAQKTLMGLGMKLGLIKLVRSNFDALLLDEASADMSEDVSLRCALALTSYCGQVISVSHRPQDVAGNVIKLG